MHHPLCASATALGLLALVSATAHAAPFDLPDIPKCTELTPGAISVDSTPVTLGLRVVLDGVSQAQAAPIVAAASTSYTPLNINLGVSYDSVNFSNTNGSQLIDEVRNFYGGSRPPGTHLVYVLTAKDLRDDGVVGDSLAGQADCIGGIAYPANAFAVGEAGGEYGAKVLAHELGHLMGGHHHYANCAEALPDGGDNICTLMINDVGLAALPFSSLNGLVVRGHAQLAGNGGAAPSNNLGSASSSSGNASGSSGGGSGGGSLSGLSLLLVAIAGLIRSRCRPSAPRA